MKQRKLRRRLDVWQKPLIHRLNFLPHDPMKAVESSKVWSTVDFPIPAQAIFSLFQLASLPSDEKIVRLTTSASLAFISLMEIEPNKECPEKMYRGMIAATQPEGISHNKQNATIEYANIFPLTYCSNSIHHRNNYILVNEYNYDPLRSADLAYLSNSTLRCIKVEERHYCLMRKIPTIFACIQTLNSRIRDIDTN